MFEIRKCSEHCPCYRAINNDSCAVLEECTPLPRKFKFIKFTSWIKSKKEASPPPPLWKQYYTHFLFGIWSWIELHAMVPFGNGKCWLNNHRTNSSMKIAHCMVDLTDNVTKTAQAFFEQSSMELDVFLVWF